MKRKVPRLGLKPSLGMTIKRKVPRLGLKPSLGMTIVQLESRVDPGLSPLSNHRVLNYNRGFWSCATLRLGVRMPLKESEAIVLRSYPLREADLLVTCFTRAEGKVRGVARAAKKSKKRFGGALEPLTYVRLYWEDRERAELARLDSCEVLESPMSTEVDYPRAVALGYLAEVLDQVLPDREAHDDLFRLTLSVLPQVQAGTIWMPLTYFDLWLVRLIGLLPELHECLECGVTLNGSRAYFHPLAEGLMCAQHKRLASTEMSAESRSTAAQMFRASVESFAGEAWPRQRGGDLRKFLQQRLELHLERKLVTAVMLDRI